MPLVINILEQPAPKYILYNIHSPECPKMART